MKADYPAHIRKLSDGNLRVQTCTEHSRNAAEYARNALESLSLGQAAYLAGLLHDTGKFKGSFAEYLEYMVSHDDSRRGSVVHSFAGVRFLFERYHTDKDEASYENIVSEILSYAIGAHHGLFDCINARHENGFSHRITNIPEGDEEAIHKFLDLCASQEEIDVLFHKAVDELSPVIDRCINIADPNDAEIMFLLGLLVRLMTSAVMEGDRRDTAKFMSDAIFPSTADRQLWKILLGRVEQKLNDLPCDTPLNQARRHISDQCRKAAAEASGIYRLRVPTGGGKTLASLRYALAHAAEFSKKRIIFVSPLLSILDQNSRVIRDFLEADDFILEHHSNVIHAETSDEKTAEYELLKDSWSTPIIITTMAQLLHTMFDGRTSSVRRFHALTDAVIVIDEVQTVPTRTLTLFHLTISFLAEICRSTVVLCSATQPCDAKAIHPIRTLVSEMLPYDAALWNVFRRTELIHAGSYRIEEIPEFAAKVLETTSSLLVVCNKKEEAVMIYHALANSDVDVFHLSASMCMKHREEVLATIFRSLDNPKRKTICVSTQVIEAGVDISFGAVIRLSAGLDSVIQAAGRCNRNGESETPLPVYIVRAEDERLAHLAEIQAAKQAMEQLLAMYEQDPERYDGDLASEMSVRAYYTDLYDLQSRQDPQCQDFPVKNQPSLFSLLSENIHWISERDDSVQNFTFRQAFASAGTAFTVFDGDTTDVIVPYGEGASVICDLLSERAKYDMGFIQECLTKAKGFTVSLFAYQRWMLDEKNALMPLAGGIMLGLAPEYYNEKTGLLTTERSDQPCDTQIW